MKTKSRFLIGIASAMVTFGLLFAFVGKPKYFGKHSCKMECTKTTEPHSPN